jgi:hypothetical protein
MRPGWFLILFLSGCAGFQADDCRRADWYDLGFRDALYGIQRQDHAYESQCALHGVTLDAARYAQGWREGRYEFEARASQSQD